MTGKVKFFTRVMNLMEEQGKPLATSEISSGLGVHNLVASKNLFHMQKLGTVAIVGKRPSEKGGTPMNVWALTNSPGEPS